MVLDKHSFELFVTYLFTKISLRFTNRWVWERRHTSSISSQNYPLRCPDTTGPIEILEDYANI